jgi:flavodoxin
MKSLIVYSSQSGNTKKLAQAVYESLTGPKDIYPVAAAPDPADYDFVALGFWLQAGKPDPWAAEYLAGIGDKKLFLFATHGAAADSAHARNAIEIAKSLAPSAQIAGTFNCPGEVSPAHLEKARKKDSPPKWIDDAPAAVGHPDSGDIKQLAEKIQACLPGLIS